MSATVTFTLARVDNVISVPLSAVFSTAESLRYVFVKKGEGFEIRPVDVGIADTRRLQILSGLEEAEEVATSRPLVFEGEPPVPVTPAAKKGPTPRRSGT
jgi:multidrug efflux pump subunit AcrA (membrane-fusion protein)